MSTESRNTSVEDADRTRAESHRDSLARLYRHLEALLCGEPYRGIEVEPYLPLVVERLSDTEVSMTHYSSLNGDAMRDPEIIFEVRQENGLRLAQPFYYRNDYAGIEHWTLERPSWGDAEIGFKPWLHEGLSQFAEQWFRNLREQGFFEADDSSTAVC